MRLAVLFGFLIAFVAVTFVQADALQDEIDSALKKFCGGIAVTGPSKGQTFSNPKKIKVTVTRKPNAQAKVIVGVDAYSINSKGKATYLTTVWKGNYKLNKKATLSVDLTKVSKLKLPGQFEFRVWVHNTKGPDCTLMSKVFKVKSSSHSNAVEEAEYKSLNENIDRGCFGVEVTSPTLGEKVPVNQQYAVQIQRDSAAHADTLTSLELYSVNIETRESKLIHSSWSGSQSINNLFNVKDTIPESAKAEDTAFYYKLTATTQHDETCEFYSHPFYVN
ncbi:hypothetical protein CU097_009944 [Rhizopus azygosporus]|uniref:Uncharacterized protein n=2 Tax=Rhizopus TaxID=4842 RepID=A0A367JPC8_RHIAZ|nr:hypothetical protein G6F69_004588 [Rhizopus microsporus]RCH91551.1 hypothetical protein CU097_009944 [Rhizopus azygosporus]KAG1233372.1 hypothetical protein G6F67_004326 [Rhizopus microsporus]KAG1266246.1 hypothetical protein G6F68_002911 [Rhizopus microsporus]ORE17432.1 hypothetical protein BCV71DRAFT_129484 [Rhizopus microsporus]